MCAQSEEKSMKIFFQTHVFSVSRIYDENVGCVREILRFVRPQDNKENTTSVVNKELSMKKIKFYFSFTFEKYIYSAKLSAEKNSRLYNIRARWMMSMIEWNVRARHTVGILLQLEGLALEVDRVVEL